MAENSKIQWTDHTWNPWRGCTKVSAGCANCYAETLSGRNPQVLGEWGPNGTRIVAAESQWREPIKWNEEAKAAGVRRRVFCASLADVFEDWRGRMCDSQARELWIEQRGARSWVYDDGSPGFAFEKNWLTMGDVRARLFALIEQTPHLDWLLLTKRPENVLKMTFAAWCPRVPGHVSQNDGDGRRWKWPANVWLGTSVENQAAADARIPHLLEIPAAVRFLSLEPLLGAVDLSEFSPFCLPLMTGTERAENPEIDANALHWAIIGGESGPKSRPARIEWIRSLVRQCREAEVPVFVKQMGGSIIDRNDSFGGWTDQQWPESLDTLSCVEENIHGFREEHQGADVLIRLNDRKGGTPEEWPADLRVREFPEAGR